jgi:hypothetical protein
MGCFRSTLLPKIVGITFNHIVLPHEILDFFPITLVLVMFFLSDYLLKTYSLLGDWEILYARGVATG